MCVLILSIKNRRENSSALPWSIWKRANQHGCCWFYYYFRLACLYALPLVAQLSSHHLQLSHSDLLALNTHPTISWASSRQWKLQKFMRAHWCRFFLLFNFLRIVFYSLAKFLPRYCSKRGQEVRTPMHHHWSLLLYFIGYRRKKEHFERWRRKILHNTA